MRYLLLAWGSRGDVQPFVALGLGLRAAGHEVTVAATLDFEAWIREQGLGYTDFGVSVAELSRTDLGRRWLGGTSRTLVGELRLMHEVSTLAADVVTTTLLRAAPGHDVLVSSTLTFEAGWALARATRIGHAIALFAPAVQTSLGSSYVYAALPGRRSTLNRVLGALTSTAVQPVIAPIAAELRRRLGSRRPTLRQLRDDIRSTPTLLAVSPHVVPPAPDWPMPVQVTGWWTLPDAPAGAPGLESPGRGDDLDAALVDFLEAGPPPVYVGFGSMSSADPRGISRVVGEACRAAGVRAVVLRGHADLHITGDDVLLIEGAPHGRLFPQVAAVVGHGGAGTTGAAFRAGVPQVVVPHMGDQPYWGRRVHELGCGPAPLARRQLTAERLAGGIRAALSPGCVDAARRLGDQVRDEDGVAAAVAHLDATFAR
ncbi:glycosyltransferase [Arsenicicoccus sp. oral taxon 190]|uniref:glycosyltransferase n=1 Tax=Arsenicicoccus sp. oral taxon 190 TaxID=1658671 RepID=UPI000679F302|nr:glycosyltransferase [Arsenicicoccus sp. oral taxon 190]AKT50486.1 hypothetical protein ADJ73_02675 [Arsenicicoccus sp. oral taxon 190]